MDKNIKEILENQIVNLLQEVYYSEFFSNIMQLCQGEATALLFLNDNSDKTVNPAQISEELNITRQRVTAILAGLRKKGFVSMELDEKDRRRMNVAITAEGTKYITSKAERAEKYLDILIDKMGIENIVNFARQLNTAAKCIDENNLK